MDLSIIVVSWNTRQLLAQCLTSIYANAPDCEFETWVVDNASSDDTAAMVRSQFPQVNLLENRENLGFARANNQAIHESTGRYVLLLNSDTIVRPGALQTMHAFMLEHPEAGIVGAFILNADGTPQVCSGKFPTLISEAASSWGLDSRFPFGRRSAHSLNSSAGWFETDWVLGAALMVRREVIDRIGGLDEQYFMYSEEVDLAYRAKKHGWRTYVLTTAQIIHLGQQSSRQVPAAMKAQLFRSKVLYFQKHHGRFAASLLQLVFASSMLAKCWVYRGQRKSGLSQMWSSTWKYFKVTNSGAERQLTVQ